MEACKRREVFLGMEEEKKRRRKCEEFFSSYVCNNQAWEECVQELGMKRTCVASTCCKTFGLLF